jgi:hypothetical protein
MAGIQVTIEAHGPTQETILRVEEGVRKHPAVLEKLGKARWRLLFTRLLEEDPEKKPRVAPAPADRFVTTVYDYTNDRALEVKGSLRARRRLDIEESAAQPWPTYEEFTDAVRIIRRHPDLGPVLREGRLRPTGPCRLWSPCSDRTAAPSARWPLVSIPSKARSATRSSG